MAKYNSGRIYNRRITDNGATYNSAPFIIVVLDSGFALDDIYNIVSGIYQTDEAESLDSITLAANINLTDQSTSTIDSITLSTNINVPDMGLSSDSLPSIKVSVPIQDTGFSIDKINIVGAYFVIDSNNVLQPLGVLVLKDSRIELIPSTRDITDEIPGMHGEFDFGTEFNSRAFDLHVATDEGYAPLEKAHLQRLFAKYLDPTKGAKTLIFSDDIEKTYVVKYSGKIDITQYPSWFEFTLPFKMSNPFITGSFEKVLIGSGTLINSGTFETSLLLEITGPITNPSLTVGGHLLSYAGIIPSGQTLVINSNGGTGTVKLAGVNAMAGYNGVFPSLPPGSTNVTAGSNVKIRWKDKWL